MADSTHSMFNIPNNLQNKIIPERSLSIQALLQYSLPPVSSKPSQVPPLTFFNISEPDFAGENIAATLQHLPIPSPSDVKELVAIRRDAVEAGFQSVVYHHLYLDAELTGEPSIQFPLWIITFWEEVVKLQDVVARWLECRDWLMVHLKQKKSVQRKELAQKAMFTLTQLPWGYNKPPGLVDTLPIHGLWRYLGQNYLSCSQIEESLELMRAEGISNFEEFSSTQFEGTPFLSFLLQAYRNRFEYESRSTWAWLHQIGDRLASSNDKLVTITSLEPFTGEQHWVSIVISEGGRKVAFGDSLGRRIPLVVSEVITWWIGYHAPTLQLSFLTLPTILQTDGNSCGIFALMAVCSALLLPRSESREAAILCLEQFLLVSSAILTRLSGRQEPAQTSPHITPILSPKSERSEQATKAVMVMTPEPTPMLSVKEELSKPVKRKLTDYWSRETKEATTQRWLRDSEQLRERCEEEGEKRTRLELLKKAHRANAKREAQQRYRERQRKALAGKRLHQSQVNEVESQVDQKLDEPSIASINTCINTTFSGTCVAEISRPHRQFKNDLHETKSVFGRKQVHQPHLSQKTNWFMPLIWSNIEQAAANAGKPWSPRYITQAAKSLNPQLFSGLKEQVVGRWIDKEAQARGVSRWSDKVLEQVRRNSPGGDTTRVGILTSYPAIQDRIKFQVTSLREAGVALTLVTIRAIMIAVIEEMAPEVFQIEAKDGSQFKCSESFVRKYLRKTLGWSEHRATKAAQKLPVNHEEILREAFLREAFIVRDYSIPAALRVNTDQTQLVYQQGSAKTWNEKGVKQVATVGQEEKRAFTLVPSISASRELLPMQAIYMGKTNVSCPSPSAPSYSRALDLGFQMLPSKSTTYWSTRQSMEILVDTIIAPYFEQKKRELGLLPTQHSIWKIDCWSVHRSQDFRSWMKEKHPNIIIVFVPGGCTSVWQPLDVGIQRVLKLSMRKTAHRDIVAEVTQQIESGQEWLTVDTTLGTLRDRSVQWVVNAIHDINNPQLILKAFEMCRVGSDWNLSQESLTSASALEALRNLPCTNRQLYNELCDVSTPEQPSLPPEVEEPPFTEFPEDDSGMSIPAFISAMTGSPSQELEHFAATVDGSLELVSMAESEMNDVSVEAAGLGGNMPALEGRSRRVRKAKVPFGGHQLWDT